MKVVRGVLSMTWHGGLGRREDLGEVTRGRSWLELPFQNLSLRVIGDKVYFTVEGREASVWGS